MKNSISILGLALLLAFPVGASTSFAAVKSQNDQLIRVLIGFDKSVGASEQALVRAYGGKIKYSYSIVNAIAAQVPESALAGLAHNPHVTAVEADDTVYAADVFDTELDNAWGVKHIQSADVHVTGNKGAGVDGGVKIGIIDSGVNYLHPDLNDNFDSLNLGYDFYYYDYDPMDVYGHGTHVAGTACAEDNDNGNADPKLGVVGVAPSCNLYSLRVLNEDGVGYWSDIIAAVEWSTGATMQIENVFTGEMLTVQGLELDVINLSLGKDRDPGSTVKQAFDNAEAQGVVIVAAVGNSGTVNGKGSNVIYPAKYDSVIAVAATDSNNTRASFSSTGDKVEIAAPGVNVYSTWNDNAGYYDPQPVCTGTLTDINGDGQPDGECYKYGSGTSMASPHVAGVAALIIAAGYSDYNGDGVINNRDVRAILDASATDLGITGRDPQFGYGLVNALLAVQTAGANITPKANAGADQTVVDFDGNNVENVILDGSSSSDSDGSIVSYEWYEGATLLATGVSPTLPFALGNHTVTLTVTDNEGAMANDSVQINVVAESSGVTLSTVGYKVKGLMKADLSWSGATSGNVDVYRNGSVITTTANDGTYTDSINQRGGGTFTYKICEAGTSVCSNESVVTF
ncbi:MAG: Peptidase S8 and S53 subtilisin kexin sedolisin [Parcubacteria group bacterium GW2011_GWB1_52_7]|nr:MAG: Peptidase S8 and S53 subtilisin kexin sedolisin [Parcubacteria group bacterium GW2011_GWA1_51_12]KKW28323.1 MAG: Peptidase S8 and S53 subtilisin kexin sedolisin [Parcubacteria group bacterium GW2011_GWB1_52_7]